MVMMIPVVSMVTRVVTERGQPRATGDYKRGRGRDRLSVCGRPGRAMGMQGHDSGRSSSPTGGTVCRASVQVSALPRQSAQA